MILNIPFNLKGDIEQIMYVDNFLALLFDRNNLASQEIGFISLNKAEVLKVLDTSFTLSGHHQKVGEE